MSKLINDLNTIPEFSVTKIETQIAESLTRIKNLNKTPVIGDNALSHLVDSIIVEEKQFVKDQLPILASLLIIRDKIK